ncbi:hypothetical protein WJX73_001617 [Symbiochloris irregularis]|uniref:Uncharacterized protein n=1 Tax=Symbiochloris irregularis TaxID=706552 RepID=A0AAW1Q287_9CHLO
MAHRGAASGLRAQECVGLCRANSCPSTRRTSSTPILRRAGSQLLSSSSLRPRCEVLRCTEDEAASSGSPCWYERSQQELPSEESAPSTSGRDHSDNRTLPVMHTPFNAHAGFKCEGMWDGSDEGFTPFPSNLPTGGGADSLPSHDLFRSSLHYMGVQEEGDSWRCLSQVWVLLFGVGTRETEGIYSLRANSRDTGMPQDTIVAFEDADDAHRYAGLLEATMEHVPLVSPINVQELLDFCQDAGYKCRLEQCGTMLYPPDYNISMTDWERSLRLREGHFEVLDTEPERLPECSSASDDSFNHSGSQGVPEDMPQLHNNAGVAPPVSDIEDARARLERQWA